MTQLCRQMTDMKKKAKSKPYPIIEDDGTKNLLQEPMAVYIPSSFIKIPSVTVFPYKRFQKLADKIPFTLKEWANILHLSERTLQRYAKNNTPFEGIYVDRILHLEELINMGLETFVNGEALYRWLKRDKPVLGHLLSFESLYSTQGIQMVIDDIGRIQYGVYI